jgi:hypothetical protein
MTTTVERNGKAHPNGTPAGTVPTGIDGNGATPPPCPDQGADGRFLPGNKAAAGNSFHRAVAARRKALLDAVSPEEVAAVGRKLTEQALAGDVPSAKVLLSYVVGKPAESPNPDRVDLDELRLLLAAPMKLELLAMALEGTTADVALDFIRKLMEPRQSIEGITDAAKSLGGASNLIDVIKNLYRARAQETTR